MTPNKLRKFGILLSVLLIGSVVFSGGALADVDNNINVDPDTQVNAQTAVVNQQQAGVGVNAAAFADDQSNTLVQVESSNVDQDSDQVIID